MKRFLFLLVILAIASDHSVNCQGGDQKCTPCGDNPPPPPPSPPPPPPIVYASPPPPTPKKTPSTPYCPPPPGSFIYLTGPPGNLYPVDPEYSGGSKNSVMTNLKVFVGCGFLGLLAFW